MGGECMTYSYRPAMPCSVMPSWERDDTLYPSKQIEIICHSQGSHVKSQSACFFVSVKEALARFLSMAALGRACANLNQAASDSHSRFSDMDSSVEDKSSSTSQLSFVLHES